MTWNTNYGIRDVDLPVAVKLFGSARRALACTGGDDRLLLLYLNSPAKVESAPEVREYEANKYAARLREMVRSEDEIEFRESVRKAWDSITGRKTLVACAEVLGVHPKTARKRLASIGLWPVRA